MANKLVNLVTVANERLVANERFVQITETHFIVIEIVNEDIMHICSLD